MDRGRTLSGEDSFRLHLDSGSISNCIARPDPVAIGALVLDRIKDLEALESDTNNEAFETLSKTDKGSDSMEKLFYDYLQNFPELLAISPIADGFQNNTEAPFSEIDHDMNTLELWLLQRHRARWRTQIGQIPLCDFDAI